MSSETARIEVDAPKVPKRFVFVLLDDFTLLSFAAAVECLRIANRLAGKQLYSWVLTGESGDIVMSSAGVRFHLDFTLDELNRDDVVLLCGGMNVQAAATKRMLNWLRREARRGLRMGGLCTASYVLAKAGLLDDKRATIHWENHDAFLEEFEDVELTKSVFVVDGNRLSTAGGTSSIDLMLSLIADDHGEKLANAVADQQIYSAIRTDQDTQRLSVPTRIGVRHPKLSQVIHMMEANIEEPLSTHELAEHLGISRRQLERLFKKYLQVVPSRYYLDVRLQRARRLLRESDRPAGEIALQTGFSSAAHFSTAYRNHFGMTPREARLA